MPDKYAIVAVDDFFKIPLNRLDDCLAEFVTSVKAVRHTAELFRLVAEANGIIMPEGFAGMPSWTWIDDGKRNQEIIIEEKKE